MLKKLTVSLLLLCSTQVLANEVNVYSAREEQLIKPLLDAFSKDNGVKVNLITGDDDPLLERLKREGANSPADVLITADAGRLHRAVEAGTLQPIQSAKLNQAIPANLRDPANQWFGLTYRARVLFYNPAKVQANELSTYEDLADPKWRKVKVFFPNQGDRGTHINISGAGVTKSAKNKENAVKLLEYMALDDAQRWYSNTNGEYPAKRGIAASPELQSWGAFKSDALNLSNLGKHNAQAVMIMDKVGWK